MQALHRRHGCYLRDREQINIFVKGRHGKTAFDDGVAGANLKPFALTETQLTQEDILNQPPYQKNGDEGGVSQGTLSIYSQRVPVQRPLSSPPPVQDALLHRVSIVHLSIQSSVCVRLLIVLVFLGFHLVRTPVHPHFFALANPMCTRWRHFIRVYSEWQSD